VSLPPSAARAEASFRAITARRLYSRRRHLFGKRSFLRLRAYEDLWPYANAWSAACTLSSLDRSSAATPFLNVLFDGLAAYHRSHTAAISTSGPVGFESVVVPPLNTGGDVFFDDNAWLALALLCHYDLTKDERAISLAVRVFDFITSGWSTEPSWIHPGGIRWKQSLATTSRNTCANGPTAEVAALVHQHTGDATALAWSIRIYDWVRRVLLGPADLYFDRITPEGAVSEEIWSYNQGTMIGTGVLLHRITGAQGYLDQAVATATAAVSQFPVAELLRQDAAFNAVFFRNLLVLDQSSPDPAFGKLAAAYTDQMWELRRDRHTGLFSGRASPLNNSAPLVELSALVARAPPHP